MPRLREPCIDNEVGAIVMPDFTSYAADTSLGLAAATAERQWHVWSDFGNAAFASCLATVQAPGKLYLCPP